MREFSLNLEDAFNIEKYASSSYPCILDKISSAVGFPLIIIILDAIETCINDLKINDLV